jgi:hypothetical protein
MEGGRGGGGGKGRAEWWAMARGMWGDHRDDLGLRVCAVGMCRRRLRSWQITILIIIIIATIIILICNRTYDNGPVASLAWLVL